MKSAVSAQKALQRSETETRELLEERKSIVFPNKGSLICPIGKSMIFYLFGPPSLRYLCTISSKLIISKNTPQLFVSLLLYFFPGGPVKGYFERHDD